ncbi:MAG TPA: Clp protease N-terminal domain-containing protein, partial [Chloroflexota bacterium]|nr:Clp protease N-terminal domain-containing protein [Chloroflexota bacterium]
MSELSTTGLSPEAVRAIDLATVIARNGGHRTVTPDHLATALLKQSDGLAGRLLRTHFGVDLFELRSRLESGLRDVRDSLTPGELTHRYNGEPYTISPALARIIARAGDLAVQQRKPVAGTDHLLAALLDEDSPATQTLASAGIVAEQVGEASANIPLPPALARRHGLPSTPWEVAPAPAPGEWNGVPGGRPSDGRDGSDGSGAVFDLVAAVREGRLPPVAERPALLQGLANLLVQPRTSVVLLGENGVGRRSLVQALAQSLARQPLPDLPPALY